MVKLKPPLYVPNHVDIEITDKCDLFCAHCGNDSNPKNDMVLDEDSIKNIMRGAKKVGITTFSVNGGEPFLVLDELCNVIEEGVKNSIIPSYIGTNASFATTVEDATYYLSELKSAGFDIMSKIDMRKLKSSRFSIPEEPYLYTKSGGLNISFDKFHQEFVPIQNVANLIKAYSDVFGNTDFIQLRGAYASGYEMNYGMFVSLLTALNEHDIAVIDCYDYEKYSGIEGFIDEFFNEEKIRLKSGDIDFYYSPVWAVGRAGCLDINLLNLDEYDFIQGSSDYCSLGNECATHIQVKPDGRVYANPEFVCESLGLYLGNVNNTPFEEIVQESQNNLILDILSLGGPHALRYFMESAGIDINVKSEDPCHFCFQVLSDKKVLGALNDFYSSSDRVELYNSYLLKNPQRVSISDITGFKCYESFEII